MADEVKNVIVHVKVEGDVKALNAIARIETALARQQSTLQRANKARNDGTKSLKDQEKQMRINAQANIQLNQQFQDFIIQAQNGTNWVVAFTQQAAQMAFVMSNSTGEVSKFAKFMAGPWGTIMFAAIALITPFTKGLLDNAEAAEELQKEHDKLTEAIQSTTKSQIDAINSTQSKLQLDLEEIQLTSRKVSGLYLQAEAEVELQQARLESLKTTREMNTAEDAGIAGIYEWITAKRAATAETELARLATEREAAARNVRGAQANLADAQIQERLSQTTKLEQDHARVVEDLHKQYRDKLIPTLQEYERLREQEERRYIAQKKAAEDAAEAERKRIAEQRRADEENRKAAEDWAKYLAEFQAGGKALYELEQQLKEVRKALDDPKLGEGERGAEGLVSARREELRLLTEIENKRNEIAAKESTYLQIQLDYAKFREETEKTTERIEKMRAEAESTVNVEYREWLLKNADALEQKLIPALAEAAAKQKAFDDAVNKRVETAAAGGKERQTIEEQMKEINAAITKAGDQGNDSAVKILTKDLQELQLQLDKLDMTLVEQKGLELMVESINMIADGLAEAIEGTKKFEDVFKEFAKMMIRELTKLIVKWLLLKLVSEAFGPASSVTAGVTKSIGLGAAKGAAFDKGKPLTAYANGGIVTRPTFFPMANGGVGLMGEAGPEAVMPLTRTSGGKLGVQSTGTNIVINNYSNSEVSATQTDDGILIEVRAAERARALVAADIRRGGGAVSKAIEGTYGTSRAR